MNKNDYPKISEAFMSTTWAILPESLQGMLDIFKARQEGRTPDVPTSLFHLSARDDDEDDSQKEYFRYASISGNVATIRLDGPIFPKANIFTYFSGGTSLDLWRTEFMAMFNNPAVDTVLINIDSPGGDVRGVAETADMIYNAREKGNKRVVAYASGLMASAAYWIGSAADIIVANKTAVIGSIGVVCGVHKPSDNEKTVEIVSTQSPKKRLDIFSNDEHKQAFQTRLDDLADVFGTEVAKFRGVDLDTVWSDFGQGDVFVAARAKEHAMVDTIDSLSDLQGLLTGAGTTVMGSSPNDNIQLQEKNEMGLKDLLKGLTNGTGANEDTSVPVTRESLEDRFSDSVKAYVSGLLLSSKITPAEQGAVISELMMALVDDELHPGAVNFINSKQEQVTGSREDAVKDKYDARTPHKLLGNAVPQVQEDKDKGQNLIELAQPETTEKDKNGPMTEERRKELLNATSRGRQVLSQAK